MFIWPFLVSPRLPADSSNTTFDSVAARLLKGQTTILDTQPTVPDNWKHLRKLMASALNWNNWISMEITEKALTLLKAVTVALFSVVTMLKQASKYKVVDNHLRLFVSFVCREQHPKSYCQIYRQLQAISVNTSIWGNITQFINREICNHINTKVSKLLNKM